jgi:hypothetical protein
MGQNTLVKIRFLIFYTIPQEKIAFFPDAFLPEALNDRAFRLPGKIEKPRPEPPGNGFSVFFMTCLTCLGEKRNLSAILSFHSRDNRAIAMPFLTNHRSETSGSHAPSMAVSRSPITRFAGFESVVPVLPFVKVIIPVS